MKSLLLSEYQEQCLLVEYLDILLSRGKVLAYSAVPNNTYTNSWKQKHKQKAEGVRPGVPDLIIVTEKNVLFIEMKKVSGGRLSDYQKNWLSVLPSKKVEAHVCKGFVQAKKVVDELIK